MGCMHGREILQNIRKMLNIIQYAEEKQVKAIIVSLDFEKYFDKIELSAPYSIPNHSVLVIILFDGQKYHLQNFKYVRLITVLYLNGLPLLGGSIKELLVAHITLF